jgi:hypothetical protein
MEEGLRSNKPPTGEVENFFKEFKSITTATGRSEWDKKIYEMIACNFIFNFIPKDYFT